VGTREKPILLALHMVHYETFCKSKSTLSYAIVGFTPHIGTALHCTYPYNIPDRGLYLASVKHTKAQKGCER
jgi:hypothetical protein